MLEANNTVKILSAMDQIVDQSVKQATQPLLEHTKQKGLCSPEKRTSDADQGLPHSHKGTSDLELHSSQDTAEGPTQAPCTPSQPGIMPSTPYQHSSTPAGTSQQLSTPEAAHQSPITPPKASQPNMIPLTPAAPTAGKPSGKAEGQSVAPSNRQSLTAAQTPARVIPLRQSGGQSDKAPSEFQPTHPDHTNTRIRAQTRQKASMPPVSLLLTRLTVLDVAQQLRFPDAELDRDFLAYVGNWARELWIESGKCAVRACFCYSGVLHLSVS